MNYFFALILIIFSVQTQASPKRILLIRHAEKPADSNSEDLSPKGYQRANAIPRLFSEQPGLGNPEALFAARFDNGHGSRRSTQTLTPLSQAIGVELQTPFLTENYQALANLLLNSKDFDGKIVMIAWTHAYIVQLARALGSAPAKTWQSKTFDRIWQIDYHVNGSVTSKDLPQNLLPGDSTK